MVKFVCIQLFQVEGTPFHKFILFHVTFMKSPILLPVFANQKKSQRIFAFMKNRQSENSVQHLFCLWAATEVDCTPSSKWHYRVPSLGTKFSISASRQCNFGLRLWVSELCGVVSVVLAHQASLVHGIFPARMGADFTKLTHFCSLITNRLWRRENSQRRSVMSPHEPLRRCSAEPWYAQETHPGVHVPKTFQSCEVYVNPGDFIAQFFKVNSEFLQNYRSQDSVVLAMDRHIHWGNRTDSTEINTHG